MAEAIVQKPSFELLTDFLYPASIRSPHPSALQLGKGFSTVMAAAGDHSCDDSVWEEDVAELKRIGFRCEGIRNGSSFSGLVACKWKHYTEALTY